MFMMAAGSILGLGDGTKWLPLVPKALAGGFGCKGCILEILLARDA
jgi:hypothetical protein